MAAISFKNVAFKYLQSDTFAISDINCEINSGQFVCITGKNASGKSTLLRLLKPEVAPVGDMLGTIQIDGINVDDMALLESASNIGYVGADADLQIVCDNVLQELLFGLECSGLDAQCMLSRLAEIAAYFDLNELLHTSISELSGGQKQILNLASVMIMRPSVLLLDEPTSELDPIAAERLISLVVKLNIELGITVVMVEHNLKRVLPFVDRLILLEDGNIVADGDAEEVYQSIDFNCTKYGTQKKDVDQLYNNVAYEGTGLWYRYTRDGGDVLCGASISQTSSSVYSIVGTNGCGKSTLLRALCGVCKPYRGKVVFSKPENSKKLSASKLDGDCRQGNNLTCALLPQNTRLLFSHETILEDIYTKKDTGPFDDEDFCRTIELCEIGDKLSRSYHSLSHGLLQRAALAKILLLKPRVLLLDEPTLGLDMWFKNELGQLLQTISEFDTTILMATHDIEFAVDYSDKIAWMFDGKVLDFEDAKKFTEGNFFYR